MLLAIGVLLLILLVIVVRIRLARGHEDVLVGPQLHARIQELFEPYEGRTLTPAGAKELELHADAVFRDTLTGVGVVPTGWAVCVVIDDVLGPVPRVCGPGGVILTVSEFERGLRDGQLELGDS